MKTVANSQQIRYACLLVSRYYGNRLGLQLS